MNKFTIRTEGIKELGAVYSDAPAWFPRFVESNMRGLGRRIAYLMRMQIRRHRYTGALEDSVESEYDTARQSVAVGPTAQRGGKWDAGLLLQRGTGPIPNLPFGPIAEWAAFKGLPAGPVWYKIKTVGVSAHPFLEETLARGDVQVAIQNTAKRLGYDLAAYTVQSIPSGGGGQLVFSQPNIFGGGE